MYETLFCERCAKSETRERSGAHNVWKSARSLMAPGIGHTLPYLSTSFYTATAVRALLRLSQASLRVDRSRGILLHLLRLLTLRLRVSRLRRAKKASFFSRTFSLRLFNSISSGDWSAPTEPVVRPTFTVWSSLRTYRTEQARPAW
jgi:hypothetical protein